MLKQNYEMLIIFVSASILLLRFLTLLTLILNRNIVPILGWTIIIKKKLRSRYNYRKEKTIKYFWYKVNEINQIKKIFIKL